MAMIWFNAVLESLGKKLNFESISSLYGNSLAKDAANIIQSANPLVKNKPIGHIASFLGAMAVPAPKKTNEDLVAENGGKLMPWDRKDIEIVEQKKPAREEGE